MKYLFTIIFVIMSFFSFAQVSNSDEGLMQRDGKIYVVVAVVLTILIGLFIYVWRIDKKIEETRE
jgi:EamA domain-containing membrane protein RarD